MLPDRVLSGMLILPNVKEPTPEGLQLLEALQPLGTPSGAAAAAPP
ncbi:MAG: hypothetical protein U1A78_36095 [Polyangia bacterium]